jgi:hypothetical protein
LGRERNPENKIATKRKKVLLVSSGIPRSQDPSRRGWRYFKVILLLESQTSHTRPDPATQH